LHPGRARQAVQRDGRQARQDSVAVAEEIPGGAGEFAVAHDHAGQQAAEEDTLGERRDQRPRAEEPGPDPVAKRPVQRHLDGEAAEDEGEEHHDERQVQARQRRPVGLGKAAPYRHREHDEP
jgi:hypothetical protein